jgi:hypothetical protein
VASKRQNLGHRYQIAPAEDDGATGHKRVFVGRHVVFGRVDCYATWPQTTGLHEERSSLDTAEMFDGAGGPHEIKILEVIRHMVHVNRAEGYALAERLNAHRSQMFRSVKSSALAACWLESTQPLSAARLSARSVAVMRHPMLANRAVSGSHPTAKPSPRTRDKQDTLVERPTDVAPLPELAMKNAGTIAQPTGRLAKFRRLHLRLSTCARYEHSYIPPTSRCVT